MLLWEMMKFTKSYCARCRVPPWYVWFHCWFNIMRLILTTICSLSQTTNLKWKTHKLSCFRLVINWMYFVATLAESFTIKYFFSIVIFPELRKHGASFSHFSQIISLSVGRTGLPTTDISIKWRNYLLRKRKCRLGMLISDLIGTEPRYGRDWNQLIIESVLRFAPNHTVSLRQELQKKFRSIWKYWKNISYCTSKS